MIGVLANDTERAVISEFFELFKTPWEFYRSDSEYDVLVCSNGAFQKSSAKLVLVYGANQEAFDRENRIEALPRLAHVVLSYNEDRLPIYQGCLTFKNATPGSVLRGTVEEAAIVEIVATNQKLLRIGFDLFQEVRFLFTQGQPATQARFPTLDTHVAVLRDLIVRSSIPLVEIPPVPDGYTFIVSLTHDIDHPAIRNHKFDHTMFGFLYRATVGSLINFCKGRRSAGFLAANWMAAFSLPLIHLGLIKDFWRRLDRYVELEAGFNSTFFVIPLKGDAGWNAEGPAPRKRAARYDIADVADQLENLISAGREIALHGIDAWRDPAKGRDERTVVERLTGERETGVRMHWLFFDQNAPATLDEAGFSYDSTVGYNETVGYRAGTSQVFKPLGTARLMELPMHIMDTALFYPDYMNLSFSRSEAVLGDFINNARRFGGVLTINWHDRSLAPERLWGEVYRKFLDDLRKTDAWFPTSAQAVAWFRKRRSAVFEKVTAENGEIRVKVSVNGQTEKLPGLRVRVNLPQPSDLSPSAQKDSTKAFADATLNDSGEARISLSQ